MGWAAPAIATVALDGVVTSLRARHRTTYRTLFNLAEPTVSLGGAATIYAVFSGIEGFGSASMLLAQAVPVVGLVTTYLLLNALLSATAIRWETAVPVRQVVRATAPYLGLNGLVCLGALTFVARPVDVTHLLPPQPLVLALVILTITYVTTKAYFAEVDTRQ